MSTIDTQVHGYRRGHQLLASSCVLSKIDQSVIDRLSDVAGPLRPNERFEPYLTGYPLPGSSRYVLARTWQDLTVPRAGCVRTRSLLIPIWSWASARSLIDFLEMLNPADFPDESTAIVREVTPMPFAQNLAPTPDFRAGELLEALFLEEPKPVAVFDTPMPDLIAVRLLTALWPALRSRFSFSTFARSPRRIEGRFFDLVFAPKDARSKFSDWPGRRVDGRADQDARHRWTSAIVARVFQDPIPQLMSEQELMLVGADSAGTPAALRIALLWEELLGKLDQTPTAALGLLDIANSRKSWDPDAMESLDPAIASAIRRAVATLPEAEGWDFVGALARKMQGRPLRLGRSELGEAAARLAAKAPEGAVALVSQSDADDAITALVPAIAEGLARNFTGNTIVSLAMARPDVLAQLVISCDVLAGKAVEDPGLIERFGSVSLSLDTRLLSAVRERLLPLLVEDRQLPAAIPLLDTLDREHLLDEVRHLGEVNDFRATSFVGPILERAKYLGAIETLRDELLAHAPSTRRDNFIFATLAPTPVDISWLLGEARIDGGLAPEWLVTLLREADRPNLAAAFSDDDLRNRILDALPDAAADVSQRALTEADLPLHVHVRLLLKVLPKLDIREGRDLVRATLERCLRGSFGGDELGAIVMLIDFDGSNFDAAWAARLGFERGVSGGIASRNLNAFAQAKAPARANMLSEIDEITQVLATRYVFDLGAGAADAFASLLGDAARSSYPAALSAAGRILPLVMRARLEPVSSLVVIAFPMVYRELAKEDDVPDLLKFVPFFDWDRCKAARHELVSAFMSSTWTPGDLALTACRCDDVGKILRKTAKSYGGEAYIDRVAGDLARLSEPCRAGVERTISNIRSDWPSKYDWRD